jgi:competence protein CoiA
MKFALFNDQRQEAQPNLFGQCPACYQAMTAKCGEVKIWHWAHKGRRTCDPWWESETEWHRAWKGRFPESWQEVVHHADNGEKHIADVKTDQGWVIEFQHSYIKPEERRSRDIYYQKLVWVVDGTRRKRDGTQFLNAINNGVPVGSLIRKSFSDECALLKEWVGSPAPVFFDFGEEQGLWWLLKGNSDGSAYVAKFSTNDFVEIHRDGATDMARDFDEFVKEIGGQVSQYESSRATLEQKQAQLRSTQDFRQHGKGRYKPPRRRL